MLSRAPIGLAWAGSGDTDGLVISDLGVEGTDEGGGTTSPSPRLCWVKNYFLVSSQMFFLPV